MGTMNTPRRGIPFSECVMEGDLPASFKSIGFEYDGSLDPRDHVCQFEGMALLHRFWDGIKCRVFATTLTGSAQQWFSQLGNGIITSFDTFVALFVHQFASWRRQSRSNLSLYGMRQKEHEPLRSYVKRFTAAALEVPEASHDVLVTSFSQGLQEGDFYTSIAKKAPRNWDELLQRAAKYVNLEDALRLKKVNTLVRVDKVVNVPKEVRMERREPNREVKGLRYTIEKNGGPRYTNYTPLTSSVRRRMRWSLLSNTTSKLPTTKLNTKR